MYFNYFKRTEEAWIISLDGYFKWYDFYAPTEYSYSCQTVALNSFVKWNLIACHGAWIER